MEKGKGIGRIGRSRSIQANFIATGGITKRKAREDDAIRGCFASTGVSAAEGDENSVAGMSVDLVECKRVRVAKVCCHKNRAAVLCAGGIDVVSAVDGLVPVRGSLRRGEGPGRPLLGVSTAWARARECPASTAREFQKPTTVLLGAWIGDRDRGSAVAGHECAGRGEAPHVRPASLACVPRSLQWARPAYSCRNLPLTSAGASRGDNQRGARMRGRQSRLSCPGR